MYKLYKYEYLENIKRIILSINQLQILPSQLQILTDKQMGTKY